MAKSIFPTVRVSAFSAQDFFDMLSPAEFYSHIEGTLKISAKKGLTLLSQNMERFDAQSLTNLIGYATTVNPDATGNLMSENTQCILNRVGGERGQYLYTNPAVVSSMSSSVQQKLLSAFSDHRFSVGEIAPGPSAG